MLVPFESLPDHARLWIYQSPRKFNSTELLTISEHLTAFIRRWAAHGVALKASFEIIYDQFIMLAVDEESHGASGCSIDDSTRTIREVGNAVGVDLFDRTHVSFHSDDDIVTINLRDLKKTFEDGLWNQHSLLVNALAANKGDLKNGLLVPAELTWLKRYLPNEKIAG